MKNRFWQSGWLFLGTVLCLACCLTSAAAAPPQFHFVDLGSLGGGNTEYTGINSQGQVAGYSLTENNAWHAFFWDPVRGMTDLGTLGGIASYADYINSQGQVAGHLVTINNYVHAFFWDPVSGMKDLGTLGGTDSYAFGINDKGQITGYSAIDGGNHAFFWDPKDGQMVDLGTLGGSASYADYINSQGQVAGRLSTSAGDHVFFWDPISSQMTDLNTMGGSNSYFAGLNNLGQVAGYSQMTGNNAVHAFFWDSKSGQMTDLDTLGGTNSYAYGINNQGQVAGHSTLTGGAWHAFFWDPKYGQMTDLGTLGGTYSYVVGINDQGGVAGGSLAVDGAEHAFFWDPVGGQMTDMGTLGGTDSFAYGINNQGQVAGYYLTEDGAEHAFFWSQETGSLDLTTLVADLPSGVTLTTAYALTDSGMIISMANGSVNNLCLLIPVTSNPPVANAGPDQTINYINSPVALDGSASTGDGLTYSWSVVNAPQGSIATFPDPKIVKPTFTPDKWGTYTVSLTVTDSQGATSSDTVQIQVSPIDRAAVVARLQSLSAGLGTIAFKNRNMKNSFVNKINAVITSIDAGNYQDALSQLRNDLLAKTDGCANSNPPAPDSNDWVTNCSDQQKIYGDLLEIITLMQYLL